MRPRSRLRARKCVWQPQRSIVCGQIWQAESGARRQHQHPPLMCWSDSPPFILPYHYNKFISERLRESRADITKPKYSLPLHIRVFLCGNARIGAGRSMSGGNLYLSHKGIGRTPERTQRGSGKGVTFHQRETAEREERRGRINFVNYFLLPAEIFRNARRTTMAKECLSPPPQSLLAKAENGLSERERCSWLTSGRFLTHSLVLTHRFCAILSKAAARRAKSLEAPFTSERTFNHHHPSIHPSVSLSPSLRQPTRPPSTHSFLFSLRQ